MFYALLANNLHGSSQLFKFISWSPGDRVIKNHEPGSWDSTIRSVTDELLLRLTDPIEISTLPTPRGRLFSLYVCHDSNVAKSPLLFIRTRIYVKTVLIELYSLRNKR